eukprot:CAMPEP_0174719724 /NCGR_PEP_ID=MMETSP1094-20130205/31832_1 /TAXON_ID=156173 /ORGANISM="Chrysochromulina brevifilum, Strain UTEX LB 985" /LENGTH=173 /DNA_ID=CAMNT_0015920079 /DNA_START=48 /DNA_END=569 /DNA_ORIENTATION=+
MALVLLLATPALRLGAPMMSMHGCGGATPFAPFNGGGSSSDQSKWAGGGQWAQRTYIRSAKIEAPVETPVEVPIEAVESPVEAAAKPEAVEIGTEPATASTEIKGVIVPSTNMTRMNGPHGVAANSFDRHSGGASPFAPFNGGGSAGDQSKWAAGGQWSSAEKYHGWSAKPTK